MNTNSKEMLAALPDFNAMFDLIEEMKKLNLKKMEFEAHIKEQEAHVFNTVMTNEKYFNNGKQPAVSYYENAYKYTGIDGELLEFRRRLNEVIADLEGMKAQYDVYKQMLDMFKTLVYQEKGMI